VTPADDGGVSDPVLDVDEAVFDVVDRIPPGRVSTYGAIGRLIGVGPRRVARALSSGGGAVPWYRVVRADGSAAEPVRVRQLELLAAEGVPMRDGRVVLSAVGWPGRDRTPSCPPFV
jgi:alkylated DNA nucleotide flippase Atl1